MADHQHIVAIREGPGVAITATSDDTLDLWQFDIANLVWGLLQTVGDLLTLNADGDVVALAAGSDGQVLTVDSGADTGLAWATGGTGSGTSPSDTAGWMPLSTVVGGTPDLVWDADNDLIPTYGPY